MLTIFAEYLKPPVPSTRYDWVAITADYDGGDPQGNGPTSRDAVIDLLELLEYDGQYQVITNGDFANPVIGHTDLPHP